MFIIRIGLVIGILMASSNPSFAQGMSLDANPGAFLHAVLTVGCYHATPVKYSDGSIDKKSGNALTQLRIGFQHMVWGADGKLKSATGIEPKVEVLLGTPMDVVSNLQTPVVKDGVLVLTLKQVGEIHATLTPDQKGDLAKGEGCKFIPMTPYTAPPQPPVVLRGLIQEGHDSGLWEGDYGDYLRFYSNGTVTEVVTGDQKARSGRYTISGSVVKFSLTSPAGTTDYDGLLRNNSLDMNWLIPTDNKRGKAHWVAVPETTKKQ